MKFTAILQVLSGVLGVQMCYAGAHPARVDDHSNCTECRADHATGDYVHPAVKVDASRAIQSKTMTT